MNIAILLPTIYRPDGLKRTLASLSTTLADVIVISEQDDYQATNIALNYMCRICRTDKPYQGPAYAWNTGLKHAQFYDAYVLANDDDEYCPNWLPEVLKVYNETKCGLIGLNDLSGKYERVGYCTHYFKTRDFIINYNGGVVACPHYACDFTDVEVYERGKRNNQFAYAEKAMVKHHWREIEDEGYALADQRRKEARDKFVERKMNNFPDDYKAIIK